MAENIVANVMDKFRADLEPHILRDISEISEDKCHHSSGFRTGSDASVIELNWHGTCCVGKVLHSVFFQDSEPTGMQRILTKFCKEISLLRELKHPNIVQFLGLYYRQSSPIPIMVMEKMECNLTELLDTYKRGSIPEYQVYGILNDVVKGLVYLHEVKEVAHRDLSSNNILVTSYLCAKIADLGSARVLNKPGGWNMSMQLTMQPGTQDFMPPEALEDPPRYGLSVDVFSFGCVIIHLITHQWPRPIGQTIRGKIISEFERRRKFIERMGYGHPLFSVVQRCLQDDANGRPSSKQVLELLESIANEQQLERTQLQDFIAKLQISAELEELKKKSSNVERANKKITELSENLRCTDEVASKAGKEVNRLQQILQARSQEIDKLNMVMRNIAEHCQLPPDQLQWMMGEAWKQQQQSHQSLLQQCDQLNANLHEKEMLISQLEHQIGELQNRKSVAGRIKGKSSEKIESLTAKLDNAQMCIDKMNQEIDEHKREITSKTEELKLKDGIIKGLQLILKKEQQSHKEKLAIQADHSAQNQQKFNKLTQKLHDELTQKCEEAQLELQIYKQQVISLEHDIRKGKELETDLYKELNGALKDLESLSNRHRSLQNENSVLKRGQPTALFSGMNDTRLAQELNHKSQQVETMHGQIKQYADILDREKRKVCVLTMENQNYQQQLQQFQAVPPHSPVHHNVNQTQPVPNSHRAAWEGQMQSPSAAYHQFNMPKTHPPDRSHTTPHFSEAYSGAGLPEPCPLCGKRFSTTEQLTMHAASCNP